MKAVTIDVDGWPEHWVELVRVFAAQLEQKAHTNGGPNARPKLPIWPGVGYPPDKLRREEIYRDVH